MQELQVYASSWITVGKRRIESYKHYSIFRRLRSVTILHEVVRSCGIRIARPVQFSHRLERSARHTREEVDAVRASLETSPSLAEIQVHVLFRGVL